TKPTIQSIRDRSHWNSANLTPTDPVTLGLCSQLELDMEVRKAAKLQAPVAEEEGARLLSPEETTEREEVGAEPEPQDSDRIDPDSVFAKLKGLKSSDL
ncbi:MAG TPA: cell cycle transcriptional regulator TrcR, partial [Afifellaceae bacterium]|nr:cell cycle transcriptional regulator TrcR [Afifellaceae bacterium]